MTQEQLALLESLLWSNLRVALLLAGVWLAIVLLRTRDGAFRHDVWLSAIAGCLLLPVLSATLPTIPLPWLPADPEIGDFATPLISGGVGVDQTSDVGSGSGVGAADAKSLDIRWTLLMAWVLGVVASTGWFAFGVARVVRSESRMRRFPDPAVERLKEELCADIGLRRRVRLLESSAGTSPHTWGVLRPRIVLPAEAQDWSSDQLRNVLLHELGHIKRFDWLRLCLMRVAASVYWFNPLIWLAVRECRFEAERACDEFVLRAGCESTDYAEQLLELMTLRQKTADIGIALGDGGFARRVRSILASTNEVRVMSKFGTGIVAMAIVSGAGVLAACQVTSGQPLESEVAEQQAEQQAAERAEARATEEAERAAVRAREEADRAALLAQQEAEQAEVSARRQAEQAARVAAIDARHGLLQAQYEALLERYSEQHPDVVRALTELQESELQLADARARLERSFAAGSELRDLERVAILERELTVQLEEQQVRIRELQRSLDETNAQLIERERELEALQTRLEETTPSP